MHARHVLDTNTFTWLVEGQLELRDLPVGELVVMPLQLAELQATKNVARRERLLAAVADVAPTVVPGESFSFGVPGAGFGEARWSSGDSFKRLFSALEAGRRHKNNQVDALIAEVALKHDWSLVTADKWLARAAQQCDISVRLLEPKK
jgi:hypothetical protein